VVAVLVAVIEAQAAVAADLAVVDLGATGQAAIVADLVEIVPAATGVTAATAGIVGGSIGAGRKGRRRSSWKS